jgi:hydrophobe/amphiphile efflux-1 (HAE1) family protein
MSRFFIDRPIFAAVLSIVITLAGAIAVFNLPLAQYPPITPPTIQVQCSYPGASAQVVAETVAAPIEQQVNGVEDMLYMSSQCTNDGNYSLGVTFKPGVNLNFAQVLVQNRVDLAQPSLPDVVRQTGVTTRKRSPDILLIVSLYSPDGSRDNLYLSNYATIQVKDELARVEGVGDVFLFGQQDYSMRIWLNPGRLASYSLTAGDVANALREQNVQVAAGALGQPPMRRGQPFQFTLATLGRLTYAEQFADVTVKATAEGSRVRLRDVAGDNRYRYRLRLDPARLKAAGLTVGEVLAALDRDGISTHDTLAAFGPAGKGLAYFATTRGRRAPSEEEFAARPLRVGPDGRTVRLSDLVTPAGGIERMPQLDERGIQLGARSEDIVSRVDGKPTVSVAIFALPDANALDTADRVIAKMEELKKSFPPGVDYQAAYDTTPFIRESVAEVFNTLRDAVILVALVVLVFLQNWRSTIIPLVAVPVAIIGTFAVMAAIGFSLNNLTLFGLVLAIGIVVDDAIVVVEAVEHHIEQGMKPREAALKAMDEVSGPVIAVALVLSAVFVPCAFISGIVGQFFRQFALTIACSTIISAFNSLTLSPALAAILLKPAGARKDPFGRLLDFALGWFFRLFNRTFTFATGAYLRGVRLALRGSVIVLVVYGGLMVLTWWGLGRLPTGYIPLQDKGYLLASVQLPDASSLERTRKVMDHIDRICHEEPAVAHTISVSGQSFAIGAYGPNFGNLFIPLKPFHERRHPVTVTTRDAEGNEHTQELSLYSTAVAQRLFARILREIPEAKVVIFGPPPVQGLGTTGGFKFYVEDRGDLGLDLLQAATENLIRKANAGRDAEGHRLTPAVIGLFTIFRNDSPLLYVDVNREHCYRLGVDLRDVFDTLQIYLGSLYVNDFNRFGRTWQVVIQAEGQYRNEVEDVRRLKVRNKKGGMVPLGTLADVRLKPGPLIVTRYNMYTAAAVNGDTTPGFSSGQSIEQLQRLAEQELPSAMTLEWTEITYMQLLAGNTAMIVFALSVVGVFLVLAAQYESWALPLAVILVVPMCILGSITGVAVSRGDVNIFTQIGFVVLVGLASKNAILIVEFAKVKREQGMSRAEATLEACRLRLRPILMTSFAFILGVLPLILSTGAGAEMRRTLGVAVFSGMVGVTLFGIFLTPVFFYVINRLSEASVFASPAVRLAGLVVLWSLVLAGFGVVGLFLALAWEVGRISLWMLILGGCLMAGVLLIFVGRALRRTEWAALWSPPPARPAETGIQIGGPSGPPEAGAGGPAVVIEQPPTDAIQAPPGQAGPPTDETPPERDGPRPEDTQE